MSIKQKIILIGIIVLAIFFRFHALTRMPGGLFPDEAANGLDINLMQAGRLQPFYERGNGREALFFYMLWGSVELFGKGPWQHHAVSALIGVLAVIACFAVAKRLMMIGQDFFDPTSQNRATNIGLLSAFLMAVSTWHIVLSRTAFRANLIPLFAALTVYFLLKTFQDMNPVNPVRSQVPQASAGAQAPLEGLIDKKTTVEDSLSLTGQARQTSNGVKQKISAFLTGVVFALGFYSYIAYRILVPVIIVLIIWPWFASGFLNGIKRYWKQFLILLFAFVIFIAPLAHYFNTHPGSFVGRSGQVSVFNPDLNQGDLIGVVGQVFWVSLKAYFTEGDLNWRHNISGFPFLSPVVSLFFGISLIMVTILGIWYIIAPRKRSVFWKYALLAGWFWGMLLPVTATGEGIPHGLRAIGTIPPAFIITGLGLYKLAEWAWQLHKRFNESKPIFKIEKLTIDASHYPRNIIIRFFLRLTVLCFALALIFQTYFSYFIYAANSPENFYAFRNDLTVVSKYIKERCRKADTYLVLDKFSVQTTDYLTSDWHGDFSDRCNVPYIQVDPENSWTLPRLSSGDEIIFTQSSVFDIKKFKEYHPESYLRMEVRNKFGQTVMAVYRVN